MKNTTESGTITRQSSFTACDITIKPSEKRHHVDVSVQPADVFYRTQSDALAITFRTDEVKNPLK
jgi:hypothetical protein